MKDLLLWQRAEEADSTSLLQNYELNIVNKDETVSELIPPPTMFCLFIVIIVSKSLGKKLEWTETLN